MSDTAMTADFAALLEEIAHRESRLAVREEALARREMQCKTILALTETARRQLTEQLES